MQCAASLDSLLALSPTSRSTADTADPRESTSSRSNSSTSTATLESLDFTSSLSMTTTTTTSTSDQMMSTDTSTPTPAAAAPGSGKENAVHSNSNSNVDANAIDEFLTGKMSNTCNTAKANISTTQNKKKTKTKECTSCNLPKSRDEYSASQWKKKNQKSNSGAGGNASGRRCIECISSAQSHAQNKAVMAAAVAIGSVGAVCANVSVDASGAGSANAGKNQKNKSKGKGLADRTNSNKSNTTKEYEDDTKMADMNMADMDDMLDDDDDDDDALTLTNFDQTNASLLTVEQSPAKQENNVNANNSANGIAAMEPIIGVIQEEETPRAADGQVFAGFSPVTTTNTAGDTNGADASANGQEQEVAEVEVEAAVEDEALMSTYSFSLYEAEISLERIWSLKSASSDDPANILTVATDALALPCFKASVLRDLTTASNNTKKQIISGTGEITVCSPTVNSMASMFATHASAFTSPSVTASADNNHDAGSPLRLTGIDTRHLADVYAQLQIVAAQSELALNDADSALTRMESILRGVVAMGAADDEDEDALIVTEMNTSGILELGLVLSDAYWVVGDATKADAVRQILTDYAKQPTSSDEADMAAPGTFEERSGMNASVQDLAATLLNVMESDNESENELEVIAEAEEDEAEEEAEIVIPATTTTKHVHFATTTTSTDSTDNSSPRSPVADELNDVSGRKIATSILKGGGYPEAGTTEEAEPENLTIANDKSSRPDVVQHLYHNYRSTFEFGKAHIPVGGMLLGLAEGTASTGIKIASLGHLDLQAIDENFIGPHVVKGLDDIIANPIIETVGGVVDGIGGAVDAVISILPFVGGGGSEEEKEE